METIANFCLLLKKIERQLGVERALALSWHLEDLAALARKRPVARSRRWRNGGILTLAASCLCASSGIAQDNAEPVYGPEVPSSELSVPAPSGIPDALDAMVEAALSSSPLVAASEAVSVGAEADLRSAKWQRFPNLSAEVLATTGGSDIADTDGIAANLTLEQPVWAGGSISSQIREARFNAEAAESRVDVTGQTLVLDIVQAYYDVVLYEGRVAVLNEGIAQYLELSEGIERRVQQQVSPKVDLTLALSRIAQREADLATAKEMRDIANGRLVELVGEEADLAAITVPDQLPTVPPEELAAEELKTCSPALEERARLVDAATAAYDNSRAQLFPRLLFQLSQNELTGARAALVLRAQTGNGLSKLSQIDRAEADIARATADLVQTDRQVRTLLRRQYARYRSGVRGAEVSDQAALASADLLASYERQFVAGRRSWLDLSNAVSEVLSARISANDNRVTAASSATTILVLTCRWQPQG